MKPIQMVDLQGQYAKIKTLVDAEMQQVINDASFIRGPQVAAFAKDLEEYLDVKHVIPCGNGTDALQIALMALDLKPGDEVIGPDFTFVATVEVAGLLGFKPVLVDVDMDTFCIDIEAVKKAITSKTKAIVPVHLFGQCANMDAIMEIAEAHNLFVVEDNAQAIGANYYAKDGSTKKAGTIGHLGTSSFFPSKNLGCYGDGGAVFTNDDALAQKCKEIVNHGMGAQYNYVRLGVNSRLDTLQAAILKCKLPHLDSYSEARMKVADYYDKAFSGSKNLKTPVRARYSNHVFHQYTLVSCDIDRKALVDYMARKGIPVKVYYPKALHSFIPYMDAARDEKDFKNTNVLCNAVISLPIHTEMEEEQLKYITSNLLAFLEKNET
jgi:UDP-2-acetamido-2-deoxy-ribo-hexuluronate aminotransferase